MATTQPKKATWRIGAREQVRMQWVVVTIILGLLAMVLNPWFVSLKETRNIQVCETNTGKISHALALYEADWDGALPPGPRWTDCVKGNLSTTSNTGFSTDNYFHCPNDPTACASSYAYNDLQAGMALNAGKSNSSVEPRLHSVRSPGRMPLVYEKHGSGYNAHKTLRTYSDLGREISKPHRIPDETGVVVRADGELERINAQRLLDLNGRRF